MSIEYAGRRARRKAKRLGSGRGRSALSAGRTWNTSILSTLYIRVKKYMHCFWYDLWSVSTVLTSQRTEAGAASEEAVNGGKSPGQTQASGFLVPCVLVVVMSVLLILALKFPTPVTGAAATSISGKSCWSSARVFPRGGIGSCELANVGTPRRHPWVFRGQGSNWRSR